MASEGDTPSPEIEEATGVIGYIKEKFNEAEEGKRADENRWIKAYKNYRGIYDSSTQFKDSERSRVFVKVTKTKVLAAYGQITDILFANGKVPISVEHTPVPEGIAEFAHLDMASQEMQAMQQQAMQNPDPYGYEGDGRELEPGATEATPIQPETTEGAPMQAGGPVANKPDQFLGNLSDLNLSKNLKPGPAKMGEPQIEPAATAARAMQKLIDDQLIETNAVTQLRHAVFECCLLGTGIVKGPFNHNKKIHNYEMDMATGEKQYSPIFKEQPKLEAISCWDFYPDPSAVDMNDCEYAIERHKLNRQQLRNLKYKPLFNLEAIDDCLAMGANLQRRGFEDDIYSSDDPTYIENRFEVLESVSYTHLTLPTKRIV